MKKLAILFLLATVLVSFSFAQVWVKGGFEAPNVTGANKGKVDPTLYTQFGATASKELGPGSIGVELQLGAGLHFGEAVLTPYALKGDSVLKGSYSLAAGPGTLAFALSTASASFGALSIGADYDGIAVGPATLGLGVAYDFNTRGADITTLPADIGPFKDDPKVGDKVTARVGVGIAGFSLTYKLTFTLNATNAAGDDESWISNIAYVDASYKVIDPLKVGVELDTTGATAKDGDYFKGFLVRPYAEFAINEKATVGGSVEIGNIGAEENAPTGDEITVNPGLWVKYTF
jgi:hypothetical protein